jgi:hypothetical protein
MFEKDIDDERTIYQEEAALRETEKSFYDILGKEYLLFLIPNEHFQVISAKIPTN